MLLNLPTGDNNEQKPTANFLQIQTTTTRSTHQRLNTSMMSFLGEQHWWAIAEHWCFYFAGRDHDLSPTSTFSLSEQKQKRQTPISTWECFCLSCNEMSGACFPTSTWARRSAQCQCKLMHKDDDTAEALLLNWALRCHTHVQKKKEGGKKKRLQAETTWIPNHLLISGVFFLNVTTNKNTHY